MKVFPQRPDLRGLSKETATEFLARGGAIRKIPPIRVEELQDDFGVAEKLQEFFGREE